MGLQFKTTTATFSSSGTQSVATSFSSTILDAQACLQGFTATYNNTDHNVQECTAEISNVSYSGNTVSMDVTFDFKDDSSHEMSGSVAILVIANAQ